MPTSRTTVPTERAERYVKQLVAHLGRKAGVEAVEAGFRLSLSTGSCVVTAWQDRIEMIASADTDPALHHVEDVVARHLERFGARAELRVSWQSASSPGSSQS
jgi:hypothetical protein